MPNATGFIAPGSNSVGIHGSWFVYSDCNDLKNQNCAAVTTPSPTASAFPNVGGKMCTSGQNPTATNPNAWGAGIAFELNDGPPQMPYDSTQSGVTGFCFDLSGPTIPTLHVAYTTVENNDDAPFEAITTPGTHTVLFSDTAELAGEPVFTFDRTKVVLVQFQIPSSPTAPVPWDFCIDGVTAVTP